MALLATVLSATPAAAKPGGSSEPNARATARNCVVSLHRGANTNAPVSCFATFTDAIRFATNGAVTDAPATPTKTATLLDKLARADRTPTAAVVEQQVVGIEYEQENYSAASWSIIMVGNARCTGPTDDVDYQWNLPETLGGIRIWDAISSFQTFFDETACFAAHFFLESYGPPRTEFTSSRTTMPGMTVGGVAANGDNNTRSIQWS